jgi:hypothetical protein
MTIFCLASVNVVSVKTHFTGFPSSKSSDRLVFCGDKLILPWKCRLESWLSDHSARCWRNLRFCCSLFHVSRKDFVVDEGVIAGFCFGGVDICIIGAIEALRLTGVVFSAPEEVLGRVIVNRSNSAASDECVQPNISASLDERGSQGVGLVTYTACP